MAKLLYMVDYVARNNRRKRVVGFKIDSDSELMERIAKLNIIEQTWVFELSEQRATQLKTLAADLDRDIRELTDEAVQLIVRRYTPS